MHRIIITLIVIFCSVGLASAGKTDSSAKRERNFIKQGNELYNDKRYSEAEVAYRKALQENENSEVARFNLASALLRQISLASGQEDTGENKTEKEALQILQDLAQNANSGSISENSYYNLGNVSFNKQQYQQSIDLYKRALRKNPDNDKARENLRLAQLKLQEQQNQNQDRNQDQQQDQNEQNQDQNQQQQQQNQDQQQDQNEQNQDQDQDQNQQQQQQNQNQEQQEQNGISDRNAEQILKAMENQENATRKKVEAMKAKEEQSNSSRYRTTKPW